MTSIINLKDNLIDRNHSLRIGEVYSVSSSEIKVLLDKETPHSVALNTGTIVNFPRINSYVLIPNERGTIACMVTWIGMEEDRKNKKDWDSLNLPTIKTKMSLMPLATIKPQRLTNTSGEDLNEEVKTIRYSMERGVTSLPSVGDAVILPTKEQLKSIVTAASEEDQRVEIGTSPYADNAEITIDPNKLFGRNLAVLGSTGSGKSCSIAGLIRWSLESAQDEINNKLEAGNKKTKNLNANPNATFIIFDYHGEYAQALSKFDIPLDITVLGDKSSDGENDSIHQIKVPLRLLNMEEWRNFAQATSQSQFPNLRNIVERLKALNNGKGLSLQVVINKMENFHDRCGDGRIANWDASMMRRLEGHLKDDQLMDIIEDEDDDKLLWKPKKIKDTQNKPRIIIIDMSNLINTTLYIVVSVMLREILEEHKKVKRNGNFCQTILVFEEAHVCISKYLDSDNEFSLSSACLKSCSSIAREGRKFGLNLVLSSQMPHEISAKVLSQCSSFLLHRIVGNEDQYHISRLIPDRLGNLLQELPNLNSKQAYLLGWATEIPKLVEMKNLEPDKRPKSDDPKIWEHWIGEK